MDRVIALFLGLKNSISHEPTLSEGIKMPLKMQLSPDTLGSPGSTKKRQGRDRRISCGGLRMRAKNVVKDVGVAGSQDGGRGCAFQLPKMASDGWDRCS